MQRRSRRRPKKKFGRFLAMLLLVSLLAVGCGWLINRLIVQGYLFPPATVHEDPNSGHKPPVTQKDPPETGGDELPDATESRIGLQSFRYHLVQVGALSNENSARSLVQLLETQGYPGTYLQEGNLYKVFAGIYPEKEAAKAIALMLEELGHEVFVKELVLPGVNLTVTGTMAPYFTAAGEHITSIETAFAELIAATAIDTASAAQVRRQIDLAHEALSALAPVNELVAFHTVLLDACADLLAAANQLNSYLEFNNQLDLLHTSGSLMDFALNYQFAQTILQKLLA